MLMVEKPNSRLKPRNLTSQNSNLTFCPFRFRFLPTLNWRGNFFLPFLMDLRRTKMPIANSTYFSWSVRKNSNGQKEEPDQEVDDDGGHEDDDQI